MPIAYSTVAKLKAQKGKIVKLEGHAHRIKGSIKDNPNLASELVALREHIEDAKAEAVTKFQLSQAYFDKLGVDFGKCFRHIHKWTTILFPESSLDFIHSN